MNELKKIIRSVRIALKGLGHAYVSDKSFRMEINYGLPLYIIVGWYLAPFSVWEFIIYTFSYLLILIVELVNTAFEKMLDRLHPEKHEFIEKSKDIASGAVFVALVFAVIVVVALVYVRFSYGTDAMIERVFV